MATRPIEIHGHRGSRGTHPENTLPSFQEALDAGADYFELDTHLSADDVPMVFHDPVLSGRVCTGIGTEIPLRSLTAKELQTWDCGSVPQPAFPRQKVIPGTHIPTLDETLRWLTGYSPKAGVNIEMKIEATEPRWLPDITAFTNAVLSLIDRYQLVKRTQLQSFDFRPLVEARKQCPGLRISCLFERMTDFISEALSVGAGAIGPHYSMVDSALVKACHSKGLKVIPWTVNDPGAWGELVRFGVDGIITDYPRDLKTFLSGAGVP